MSSDFERRLRDALHTTAAQVETSPETWQRVSAGIRRRRLGQWLSVGLASVAAVVVAVAVVPGLLAGDRIGLDPGPAAPAAVPTGPAAVAPPAGVVTTDGTRILVQLGAQGTDELEVPGAELSSLAVWPRSTARAFQVVAVDEAACRLHLYASGLEAVRPVDAGDAGDARVCGPVTFSPDGRHLAWIETGQDEAMLRTIGWDAEGPRFQDNAAFGLGTDLTDLRLQDWVWSATAGEDATGYLVIGGAGDNRQAHRFPIERQGDGGVAVPRGAALEPISAGAAAGGVVVAEAESGGVRYQLRAAPDVGGEGVQLARIPGGADAPNIAPDPVPAGDTLWVTAAGDRVLYGNGRDAFSSRFSQGWGTVATLPGVRAADFLPRLEPRPSG